MAARVGIVTLLGAVTATGISAAIKLHQSPSKKTIHAFGTTSAGSGAATIIIEVSNVAAPGTAATAPNWITAGTITLTLGTTQTDDGFALDASWSFIRARLSAISGTTATVSVLLGS